MNSLMNASSLLSKEITLSKDEVVLKRYDLVQDAARIVLTNKRLFAISFSTKHEIPISDAQSIETYFCKWRDRLSFFDYIFAIILLVAGIVLSKVFGITPIAFAGAGVGLVYLIVKLFDRKVHIDLKLTFSTYDIVMNHMSIGGTKGFDLLEMTNLFRFLKRRTKNGKLKENYLDNLFDMYRISSILNEIGAEIINIQEKNK